MIKQSFFQLFKWQILFLISATLIGFYFQHPLIAFTLTLSFFYIYGLTQQYALLKWLTNRKKQDLPEQSGVWGSIFNSLYLSERKNIKKNARIREQLKRMTASAQSLQNGVIMLGESANLQWWNQSAANLLGLKNNDKQLIFTNYLRDPNFIDYFNLANYEKPIEIASPINHQCRLEISISIFNQSERLLLIRDISKWKYLEKMRQDFVANASHELRTPLTVLTGYLETFSDQPLPPAMQRGFRQMQQQCHRMNGLVEDLLVLTKLDQPLIGSQLAFVKVAPIVRQICSDAKKIEQYAEQSIEFNIPESASLAAIESELRSAISNLVFNAVKYSYPDSRIKIHWQETERSTSITVSDNGPGIENQHIPRLTERFYRIDQSHSSQTGGTGLGLAIVKHIAQRHQGHLDIQSTIGKGSEFKLVFNK